MDIDNLSSKEFLSLSTKEQQSILSELEDSNNKYNEFKVAKNLAEIKERRKQIGYYIYRYDAILSNIKNRLFILNNDEGYEIFLTEQELNDVEEYGLTQLMINAIKSHKAYDIHSNIYMGYKYNVKRDSIDIYNDNLAFSISNIKDKLNYNFDLSCYKYAYVLHYRKLCWRNGKSFLWRLLHRRKCKIYY